MGNNCMLVIGGGQAGVQICESLREYRYKGNIVMATDENYLPYNRPPLSKKYISDPNGYSDDNLLIRTNKFFDNHKIDLMIGTRVETIKPRENEAITSCGKTIKYDALAIATGASYKPLPNSVLPKHIDGVHYLRGINDAKMIRVSAERAKSATVIGGGYLGLETAASLKSMGLEVKLIHSSKMLLSRTSGAHTAEYIMNLHREKGTEIITNTRVSLIEKDGGLLKAHTSNGDLIMSDLIVVGIGAIPNTQVAESCGIAVNSGITVDERCQTSQPNIYASGDCTSLAWGEWQNLTLESIQNAVDQSKIAAANMLGKNAIYEPKPWFWSDQYDCKILIAGLNTGYDECIKTDRGPNAISVWYFKKGTFIAVDCINSPRDYAKSKMLLHKNEPFSLEDFLNSGKQIPLPKN